MIILSKLIVKSKYSGLVIKQIFNYKIITLCTSFHPHPHPQENLTQIFLILGENLPQIFSNFGRKSPSNFLRFSEKIHFKTFF